MSCCNDIKAGDFRNTIIIERATKTHNGSGGFTTLWSTHKTLRSKIKPLSGRERVFASRLESNITHRITLRYTTDILTTDRVSFNGRLFQIRAILNIDEANRCLEISAEEGVAQ